MTEGPPLTTSSCAVVSSRRDRLWSRRVIVGLVCDLWSLTGCPLARERQRYGYLLDTQRPFSSVGAIKPTRAPRTCSSASAWAERYSSPSSQSR